MSSCEALLRARAPRAACSCAFRGDVDSARSEKRELPSVSPLPSPSPGAVGRGDLVFRPRTSSARAALYLALVVPGPRQLCGTARYGGCSRSGSAGESPERFLWEAHSAGSGHSPGAWRGRALSPPVGTRPPPPQSRFSRGESFGHWRETTCPAPRRPRRPIHGRVPRAELPHVVGSWKAGSVCGLAISGPVSVY